MALMASRGRATRGAKPTSIGPPAQWIAPLPSDRTTTFAPPAANRTAVSRPARPAPMTATSALGIGGRARPDHAFESKRAPLEPGRDQCLLELPAVGDRLRAALAFADEVGHCLFGH